MKEKKKFDPYVFHSPGSPVQGVRVTVVGVLEGDALKFGVSRCGIEDRYEFKKSKGIEIALAKIENGDIFTTIKFETPNLNKFISVAKVISEIVLKHSTCKNAKFEITENYEVKVV